MPTVLFWISSFVFIFSAHAGDFQARILERGTRKPLDGVTIFILPEGSLSQNTGASKNDPSQRLRLTTNSKGEISFNPSTITQDLTQSGAKLKIIINAPDYNRLEKTIPISENNPTFYLERSESMMLETTIRDQKKKTSPSQRTLKQADFLAAPGANADPVRALQNLAGVNRVQGLGSQVVIQGAGPQDTAYLIDQHEVPIIFHFGGLSSVVSPFAVENVDLMAAGFGAQYGRANGGLVNLTTRNGRRDRMHGVGFVDLLNAGLQFEGPIGQSSETEEAKGGWIISGRQSYIGHVLRAVLKDNENFDLTVAPTYRDLTLGLDTQLTDRDHIKITSVYSRDELNFLFKQPVKADPSIRGSFDNKTEFYRFIPQWTHEHSARSKTRFSLGIGKDKIEVNAGENNFDLDVTSLTTRGEYERTIDPRWIQRVGFDHSYGWADVGLSLPDFFNGGGVSNPLSSGTRREARVKSEVHQMGGYLTAELKPTSASAWTLIPQIRFDHYTQTEESLVQPRFAAEFKQSEAVTYRTAFGLYSQAPEPQQSDQLFGNPEVKAPRSLHGTIGAEWDLRQGSSEGFSGESDFFVRQFRHLVVPSSRLISRAGQLTAENFTNTGRGYAFGVQNEVKWSSSTWNARLIYTLSQSRRNQGGVGGSGSSGWAPAPFDQTHLLGLIGSYTSGKWMFSTRFRYATGNPITPVRDAVFDSDSDVYVPVRGAFYSERLPAFYQLDLRVDRRWIFDTWILSVYLDIQNTTNRRNPEGVVYSFDYKDRDTVAGLPILPLLGVKGEF